MSSNWHFQPFIIWHRFNIQFQVKWIYPLLWARELEFEQVDDSILANTTVTWAERYQWDKWLNFWLKMGLLGGRINWGANQCLAPSVKRGKIRVCRAICNLIGQKRDTWSDWQDTECKPRKNSRLLNDLRPNWSKEWHLIRLARPRAINWSKNHSHGFVGERKSYQQSHQRRFKNHMAAKLTVALVYCSWR